VAVDGDHFGFTPENLVTLLKQGSPRSLAMLDESLGRCARDLPERVCPLRVFPEEFRRVEDDRNNLHDQKARAERGASRMLFCGDAVFVSAGEPVFYATTWSAAEEDKRLSIVVEPSDLDGESKYAVRASGGLAPRTPPCRSPRRWFRDQRNRDRRTMRRRAPPTVLKQRPRRRLRISGGDTGSQGHPRTGSEAVHSRPRTTTRSASSGPGSGRRMAHSYNETTLEQLKTVLEDKLTQEGGTSLPELKEAVDGVYSFADERRAGLISKTKAFRAANLANKDAWRLSDVGQKFYRWPGCQT
jgi:hypothetical protein